MFQSFNSHYLNYTYHTNFNKLNEYLKTVNNKSLYKFYNSISFREQTENINQILFSNNSNIEQKNGILKEIIELDKDKISKINEDYFFYYSYKLKKIMIAYYNTNNQLDYISYLRDSYLNFTEQIYSISSSINNQKFYVCLLNKKTIQIFEYDLVDKNMKISEEQIIDYPISQNDHFYKCIELPNNLIATSDNIKISIWRKNNANKLYSKKIDILLSEKPNDILAINYDCFILSNYKSSKIIFYDINSFNKIKEIQNIDPINSDDCLFLYKSYIIINCIGGIALLLIKNKKLIQYINFEGYYNKKLCITNNEIFYMMDNSKKVSIMKLKFENGYFIPLEEFKDIEVENENKNINYERNFIENIIVNKNNIIVWGKYIYVLKEKEKEKEKIKSEDNESEVN